jgi:hypothetical protein
MSLFFSFITFTTNHLYKYKLISFNIKIIIYYILIMKDFVSIRNFKHLFNLLNSYSKDKYNVSLDFKKYKFIIGNTIEEIYSEYKYKINKKQGNAMTIHVLKSIIKKNIEKNILKLKLKKIRVIII